MTTHEGSEADDKFDAWRAEMQRERETQERDWNIEPNRDYPNVFDITFSLSPNTRTTVTAVNASELSALGAQIGVFLESLGSFVKTPKEWTEFAARRARWEDD